MDPDAALSNLRNAIKQFHGGDRSAADRLAEAAEALDGWMSRGGFPPKAWKR